jgi:transposase
VGRESNSQHGESLNGIQAYLREFSTHNPKEYKIVVIDNAGFHSTKNIEVPQNIVLLRIPPYNPELNPCEQVWQYIKNRFKNQRFESMKSLKDWLSEMVCEMKPETIKSITGNHHFLKTLNTAFNN